MKGFTEGQIVPNVISFFDFHIYWNFRRALVMEALGQGQEAAKSAIEAIFLLDDVRFAFPFDTSTAVLQGYRLGLFNDYYKSAIRIMMNQYGKNDNKDDKLNDSNILKATFLCAENIKAQNLIGSVIKRVRDFSPPKISKELAVDEKNLLNQYWNIEHPQGSSSWSSQDISYLINRKNMYQNYIYNFRNFVDALYSKDPNYAMVYYSRPLRLDEIPLNNDELLVEYVMTNDSIYCIISEKKGEKTYGHINIISNKRKEFEREVDKLLALASKFWNSNDEYSSLANKLCHKLLGDVVNNASHKKLIIVPDGIIGLIPFDALVIKKGTGFKDNIYLSDKFLTTYCQSGSFLALLRKSSSNIRPVKTLLALGNPNIKGRMPLKGSESEVREIADIFGDKSAPPDLILGNSATKNEINKVGLNDYKYLHFATHCEGFNNSPCLLLSNIDGENSNRLEIDDVINWKLNADLVVLSACSTGMGQKIDGEGLVNFAWAFHYAGAKRVMITLWPIEDNIAKEFIRAFYTNIKDGASLIEALQKSQKMIRKKGGKYANPFYWAPFILHGK